MTKDEALRLALEALERCVATCFDQYAHEQVKSRPEHFVNQSITAIKKALAQPEQEPVATDWERIARVQDAKLRAICNEAGGFEKLCEVMDKYERTTPPPVAEPHKRKPLTDEEIRRANHHMVDGAYDYSFKQGVKWAEYKHGIKGEA